MAIECSADVVKHQADLIPEKGHRVQHKSDHAKVVDSRKGFLAVKHNYIEYDMRATLRRSGGWLPKTLNAGAIDDLKVTMELYHDS